MPGEPADVIAAVTHPDPYPYYARLVAERPLFFDERLGAWVATSASAVASVLTSPACRVRPPSAPVPRELEGSAAGVIFAALVRMNDGSAHADARGHVLETLRHFDAHRVARVSAQRADALAQTLTASANGEALSHFALALPVHVVATLLGAGEAQLGPVAQDVAALAHCVFYGGSPVEIESGKAAAAALLERFAAPGMDVAGVANRIGLMTQARNATGGLVCATLLALARRPGLTRQLRAGVTELADVVAEVLRHDSPTHNTRRYVAEPLTIEGRALQAGDAIIVVVAAANRDPAANPSPTCFDITRPLRTLFSFGFGPHACPGRELACAIAAAGVARLLAAGIAPERSTVTSYQAFPNVRIPRLEVAGD